MGARSSGPLLRRDVLLLHANLEIVAGGIELDHGHDERSANLCVIGNALELLSEAELDNKHDELPKLAPPTYNKPLTDPR